MVRSRGLGMANRGSKGPVAVMIQSFAKRLFYL
jgi:hypothetical protein